MVISCGHLFLLQQLDDLLPPPPPPPSHRTPSSEAYHRCRRRRAADDVGLPLVRGLGPPLTLWVRRGCVPSQDGKKGLSCLSLLSSSSSLQFSSFSSQGSCLRSSWSARSRQPLHLPLLAFGTFLFSCARYSREGLVAPSSAPPSSARLDFSLEISFTAPVLVTGHPEVGTSLVVWGRPESTSRTGVSSLPLRNPTGSQDASLVSGSQVATGRLRLPRDLPTPATLLGSSGRGCPMSPFLVLLPPPPCSPPAVPPPFPRGTDSFP